jgi:hypothetical protein
MEEEDQKLRNTPSDPFLPDNVFEEGEGHFWGIHETRPYMRSRYALVEALIKVNTFDAIQAANDHLRDMPRLCRGDNMGVRDLVPGLLLRLGRDQECYDFIKWYGTQGKASDYDWGDMDLPYLDVKNADVFEAPDFLCGEYLSLSQTVAAALIKIKVMLDLEDLAALNDLGNGAKKVPQEIVDNIKKFTPRSTIVSSNKDLMDGKAGHVQPNKLALQIGNMYKAVREYNKHFWPTLVNPGRYLGARPVAYSHGSVEEMHLILNYCYAAWAETPGALKWIQEKFIDCY